MVKRTIDMFICFYVLYHEHETYLANCTIRIPLKEVDTVRLTSLIANANHYMNMFYFVFVIILYQDQGNEPPSAASI